MDPGSKGSTEIGQVPEPLSRRARGLTTQETSGASEPGQGGNGGLFQMNPLGSEKEKNLFKVSQLGGDAAGGHMGLAPEPRLSPSFIHPSTHSFTIACLQAWC